MPPTSRKNGPLTLLTMLAMLLAAMACLPSVSRGDSLKRLLVLNSYSPGYKWTNDEIRGIAEAVEEADNTVRIHCEFMDTKRVSDAEYFRLLYETYRYKFRNTRFDVIITTDNDALEFMLKYRDRLFPGTPVVFCGVNYFEPSQLHGARLFTGVNEAPDLKATLDLALKLQPKTRQIVVIGDTTTTGLLVHSALLQVLPAYRDRVNFVFLEDTDMPEILAKVRGLKADSLIFYIFFFRDKNGKVFDFDQSISMITRESPVPIYGTWDFNLGYGMVGGLLTSGYDQGKTAGTMAIRILRGEKVENIPIVMNSPNHYMFDYRQLRRFGIDLSALPPDSVVINRPARFYTVPPLVIWGTVAALAALVLIILLLLRTMAARKKAEDELRSLTEELEKRVEERTKELQEAYLGLQAETEERIRVMEELRQKDQLLIHQSRMAAVGEVLSNIAHHWRQPLNVLGLRVQEIGFSSKLGSFSKELLDTNIAKAMEILNGLSKTIDDFRTFSLQDKQLVTFKVNEVIEKTVSLIAENFREQGIVIETSSAGEPQIDGYPNEYAQALLNILMNSRDAFKERQISDARITLRSWTEDGRSEVLISDNAGGIEEGILDKIFDAYFTTKELGKGSGIGLFMSKKIIEKNMGGRLTARNTDGGVEFRITV